MSLESRLGRLEEAIKNGFKAQLTPEEKELFYWHVLFFYAKEKFTPEDKIKLEPLLVRAGEVLDGFCSSFNDSTKETEEINDVISILLNKDVFEKNSIWHRLTDVIYPIDWPKLP